MRVATILALLASGVSSAADWPQFRGPGGAAVFDGRPVPAEWSAKTNVAWTAEPPGYGWSSPVVAGGTVFVTTAVAERQTPPQFKGPGGGDPPPDAVFRWEVHAFDLATGKPLWKQTVAEHKPTNGTHLTNTYASETPAVDGERVYAFFGTVGLFCYDRGGTFLWKKEFAPYRTFGNWGTGSSPVADGGRVFVQCDNEERSFVVAFDGKTGRELWRTPRPERSTWGTPVVWANAGRTELVLMGTKRIRSYDPATGKVLWELTTDEGAGGQRPGGGKGAAGGCKSTPTATRDLIFVGMAPKKSGQQLGPMWAVKAGATSDVSLRAGETANAHVAWYRPDAGPHFASAVAYDGLLYVAPPHDGVLRCFDAKTGADVYQKKLTGAGDFKASLWAGDGKVFALDERGRTFVVKAGRDFELLRTNDIGDKCWATPAVADGALLIRGIDSLHCVRADKLP